MSVFVDKCVLSILDPEVTTRELRSLKPILLFKQVPDLTTHITNSHTLTVVNQLSRNV